MLVSAFDYQLPERLIAQEPVARRDQSRLLVIHRASGALTDTFFYTLPDYLRRGDVLVVNNTRVFPARLIGRRRTLDSNTTTVGARVEVFLVRRLEANLWETLVKPGKALRPGTQVEFADGVLTGEVVEWLAAGRRLIRFSGADDFDAAVDRIGRTPLPPYIKRSDESRFDSERYQTVFARERGAIAAPTAGLHLTPELLDRLRAQGVEVVALTLHVGYGTFQPVRVERVEDHQVEPESYSIGEEAAACLNRALAEGRRVIAVGTTTTRALESARRQTEEEEKGREEDKEIRQWATSRTGDNGSLSNPLSPLFPFSDSVTYATTSLFIYPGFEFRVLSGLVTNFHLPRSSLLMLVAAFGGYDLMMRAYHHAVEQAYRFYSYGDAMLIL